MAIVAAESMSGFFLEVVEDALKSRRVEATGSTTSYLVALLTDYAHPGSRAGEALARPLAFLLHEAVGHPDPAERFERLRSLGDGVLYSCGFFGDHFEARGVDQRYLFGIGATAYGTASAMLLRSTPDTSSLRADEPPVDIFGDLAQRFGAFVDVLTDVADSTITMGTADAKSLLKVYERWLKTGSDRLAQTLTSHGLVPTRGVKGVLQ
jgi:hypothetical protein